MSTLTISTLQLVLGINGLVLLVAAVWLTTRRYYLTPLRRLLKEIRGCRYGERSPQITPGRRGMLGHLSHEFMLMQAALAQAYADMEKAQNSAESKVLERTRNLYSMVRQLEKTAQTDNLTGLVNRLSFDDNLKQLFEQAQKQGVDLSCLMIDIDNFKFVNDSLGHVVGDDVLVFVGQLLRACIRPGDVAARYGGDEFVLLLPMCTREQAREVAERIRTLFRREVTHYTPVPYIEQPTQTLGLSIGLSSLNYNEPQTAQELLEKADEALYRAKKRGRNNVAFI